ncbi:hypothetical protein [Lacticaseibacillus paracasei]|uniref:hypothetical protein n=1 Tax=Lacticaseibacillus paracasei TaxID=1597 RepID=UPI00076158BB|nr:hypothetical protein [Lacticaseibacillus paracasei]AWN84169.1 hypothetical protein LPEG9_09325 [Lacticaseibacillus paracasei]
MAATDFKDEGWQLVSYSVHCLFVIVKPDNGELLADDLIRDSICSADGKLLHLDYIYYSFLKRIQHYAIDDVNETITTRVVGRKDVIDRFSVPQIDGSWLQQNIVKSLIKCQGQYELRFNSKFVKYRVLFFLKSFSDKLSENSFSLTYGFLKQKNEKNLSKTAATKTNQRFDLLIEKSDSIKRFITKDTYSNYFK